MNVENQRTISVIIPAKNEATSLRVLLPDLTKLLPEAEIIVVDDGSTDDTLQVCDLSKVTVISHPYSMGNGAAVKSGARAAKGDVLVFMDADGQHKPDDIPRLLDKISEGYEMVVGARHKDTHASLTRRTGNEIFNRFASILTGQKILDLTSGFRAVRSRHFKKFLYLLPNGFSYPTTSTMAFFRSGLPVAYVSIKAETRIGDSKINITKDGMRFLLIIIKIGSLFSPMRVFLPTSAFIFITGLLYYLYTYFTSGRFTNMSALLFTTSIIVFMIGIVSEQIAALHYKDTDQDFRRTKRD